MCLVWGETGERWICGTGRKKGITERKIEEKERSITKLAPIFETYRLVCKLGISPLPLSESESVVVNERRGSSWEAGAPQKATVREFSD